MGLCAKVHNMGIAAASMVIAAPPLVTTNLSICCLQLTIKAHCEASTCQSSFGQCSALSSSGSSVTRSFSTFSSSAQSSSASTSTSKSSSRSSSAVTSITQSSSVILSTPNVPSSSSTSSSSAAVTSSTSAYLASNFCFRAISPTSVSGQVITNSGPRSNLVLQGPDSLSPQNKPQPAYFNVLASSGSLQTVEGLFVATTTTDISGAKGLNAFTTNQLGSNNILLTCAVASGVLQCTATVSSNALTTFALPNNGNIVFFPAVHHRIHFRLFNLDYFMERTVPVHLCPLSQGFLLLSVSISMIV